MKLPGFPDRMPEFRGPRSSVTTGDFNNLGQAINQADQSMADALTEIGAPAAEAAGAASVQRDGQGNVTLGPAPFVMGKLGEIYTRSAHAAYLSNIDQAAQQYATDLHNKTWLPTDQGGGGGDPQWFKNSMDAYNRAQTAAAPAIWRGDVARAGGALLTQHFDHLQNQRATLDGEQFKTSMMTRLTSLDDQNSALALNNYNGPEFQDGLAKYNATWDALASDPRTGITQDVADAKKDTAASQYKVQSIIGSVQRAYDPKIGGSYDRAEELAGTILTDPSLRMSAHDRQSNYRVAMGEIRQLEAGRLADVSALNQEGQTYINLLKSGGTLDPAVKDDFIDRASKAGAASVLESLQREQFKTDQFSLFGRMNNRGFADYMATGVQPPGQFQPPPNMETLPAGMRNNNPGNIKFFPGNRFQGAIGPSSNLDEGTPQIKFDTAQHGMDAMYGLALRKNQAGLDTVQKMITDQRSGWTPGFQEAADNVAKTMGVGVNDKIDLTDPQTAHSFMRALMLQEHGEASRQYSDQMIDQSIRSRGAAAPGAGAAPTMGAIPTDSKGNSRAIDIARSFIGADEVKDAPGLTAFFKKSAGLDLNPQETAWCAAFVNSVLGASGTRGTGSLAARSFLNYGTPVSKPTEGDIVVLSRGPDPTKGHVGFFQGIDSDGNVHVLGGNQHNGVSEAVFPASQVLGYRHPPSAGTALPPGAAGAPEAAGLQPGAVAAQQAAGGYGPRPPLASVARRQAGMDVYAANEQRRQMVEAGQIPYTADPVAIQAVKSEAQERLKLTLPILTKSLDSYDVNSISDEDMDALKTMAGMGGTPEQQQQVAELAAKRVLGKEAMQMPTPEFEAELNRQREDVHRQGDQAAQNAVDWAQNKLGPELAKRFRDDPWSAAVLAGYKVPSAQSTIDFSNPQALSMGLAARARDAGIIQANRRMPAFSAFTPAESENAKQILSSGTVDQKVQLLASVTALPEDMARATLAKLGQGANVDPELVAGSIIKDAPQISHSILSGLEIMKNKAFDDKWKDFETEFAKVLPPAQFAMDATGNTTSKTWEALNTAVRARLADQSFQKGETDPSWNSTVVEKALNDVTGGVVWWGRANPVIVPKYGMGANAFSRVMNGLTPADLQGAVGPSGKPLTPNDLTGMLSSLKLQSIGDAKYLLYQDTVGPNGQPYRLYVQSNSLRAAREGGAYMLDLKGPTDRVLLGR